MFVLVSRTTAGLTFEGSDTLLRRIALSAVAIVLVCHFLRIAAGGYTLWLDEAMLFTSISATPWSRIFSPLPYYDQAAPLLYVATIKAISDLFGLNEFLLRLPAFIGMCTAVALMLSLPRLTPLQRALAVTVVLSSVVCARTATDMKQYTWDIAAVCFLMRYFAADYSAARGKSWLLLSVVLMSAIAASCFPLAVVAVGVSMIAQNVSANSSVVRLTFGTRLRLASQPNVRCKNYTRTIKLLVFPGVPTFARNSAERGSKCRNRNTRPWSRKNLIHTALQANTLKSLIILIGGLAVFAVYYSVYISPSFRFALTNYSFDYRQVGFNSDGTFYPVWFIQKLQAIIETNFGALWPAVLFLAMFGTVSCVQRREAYPIQFAALLTAMVALNLTGLYPILEDRFTVFMLPWIGILVACGVTDVLARIAAPAIRVIAGGGLVGLALWAVLAYAADPFNQQARLAITRLSQDTATPVAVMITSQPVYDAYFNGARLAGGAACVDRPGTERVKTATNRCTNLMAPGDGTFNGAETKWYLMNYVAVSAWREALTGFPGASLAVFSDAYFDWLAGAIKQHPRIYIFSVQHTRGDLAKLMGRLEGAGTVTPVVDERRPASGWSKGAAQVFLFEARQTGLAKTAVAKD